MFRTASYLAALAALSATVTPAPVPSAVAITNNPTDVLLRADFPGGNAQTVVGVIQFYSLNGTTKVHVDVTGLPKNSGMFTYHIHDKPVGADGSCAGTGPHFNPFGASPDCEAVGDDSLCEIGDLSGKHGLINTTCFELFYYDPYLSLDHNSPQYVGGKAINIHLENGDRLACATIKPSREPEDLLLLNVETEAEEVRKFEELAGISHSASQPLQASAVIAEDLPSTGSISAELPTPLEQLSLLEEPETVDVPDTEEWVSYVEDEQEEEEVVEPESDLDDLILEDLEDETLTKNSTASNETTYGVISNSTKAFNESDASGSDEEENRASSLNSYAAAFGAAFLALLLF